MEGAQKVVEQRVPEPMLKANHGILADPAKQRMLKHDRDKLTKMGGKNTTVAYPESVTGQGEKSRLQMWLCNRATITTVLTTVTARVGLQETVKEVSKGLKGLGKQEMDKTNRPYRQTNLQTKFNLNVNSIQLVRQTDNFQSNFVYHY